MKHNDKSKAKAKPKFQRKWFEDRITLKGFTQRQMASLLGIDQSSLSHTLSGRRRLSLAEAEKWANLLSEPLQSVLTNAGIELPLSLSAEQNFRSAKIIGVVDQNLIVHEQSLTGPGSTAPNTTGHRDVKVLRCQTSGSPFEGIDGALLYYLKDAEVVHPDALGRICVVRILGQSEFIVRVVKRGYAPGVHNLTLLNGVLQEVGVELSTAWPVIWMKL